MSRNRWTRVSLVFTLGLIAFSEQARAQFPKETEPNFKEKLKAALATIKPLPLTPIPDDPPPHERAFFDLPYVIEPPDILIVEVLEALPGRPITGQRLVRPDGTISLGFYGDVHVRGLTREQAKVKIIEHLRVFLPDVVLGLEEEAPQFDPGVLPPQPPKPEEDDLKDAPAGKGVKDQKPEEGKPSIEGVSRRPAAFRPHRRESGKPSAEGQRAISAAARRVRQASDQPADPEPPKPTPLVSLPVGDGLTITIQITPDHAQTPTMPESLRKILPYIGPQPKAGGAVIPAPPMDDDSTGFKTVLVAPADSNRVFVDASAYNSQFYYVTGDVAAPGKLPFTGTETVFDALNFAGGLIATADSKNIHLIRPARGGKPAKDYRVDYAAIVEKGETRQNYQLFPGDRLVVGRRSAIQATIDLDRAGNVLQSLIGV